MKPFNNRNRFGFNHWSIMMMLLFLACVPLTARGNPKPAQASPVDGASEEWITKIVELQYADPVDLAEMISAVGVRAIPNQKFNAISLTGTPAAVQAAEQLIRRFDVLPEETLNIETRAYLLIASEKAVKNGTLPTEVSDVVDELKKIFPYKGYSILDTLLIRSRDGENASLNGILSGREVLKEVMADREILQSPQYDLQFRARVRQSGQTVVLTYDNLHLEVLMVVGETGADGHTAKNTSNAKINTDIDVREGQKAVVGKANIEGGNNALIFILSPSIIRNENTGLEFISEGEDDRVTLHLVDVPLMTLLETIAEVTGRELEFHGTASEDTVTLELKDASLIDVMNNVAKVFGLNYELKGNKLIVNQ